MLNDHEYTDDLTDEEKEKFRVMETLAETLLKKRDEAVTFRVSSGVERRWLEDENLFDGNDPEMTRRGMMDYASGEAPPRGDSQPNRSKVIVNIVRGKCETAEGRFSDILLPVDDRNWGLEVTPVPQISDDLKDRSKVTLEDGRQVPGPNGQELTKSDLAKAVVEQAEKKMRGMEREVDDQLTEAGYNGECRKAIKDSIRLGTGILKGPNVVKQVRKSWMPQEGTDEAGEAQTVHVLETHEDFTPASRSVSPWQVYPDPGCGDDIARAAYFWERDVVLPRELRDLIGVPGYFEDQIIKALQEEPKRLTVSVTKNGHNKAEQEALDKGSAYERWEYNGDLNREDLEALGVDISHDLHSQSLAACVVFVNDRPIKVQLNTLDTGDMPYDFFQWTGVAGSPWGIGIPRMLVWQQGIITAAWRAMMDNAGDSAGANIVLSNDIVPGDQKWEITGKKIWRAKPGSSVDDVRKAFAQFQIANNQDALQQIVELALRFTDMETSLPTMFEGERKDQPETLGATNIMVDSNNVALRSRVKRWDDQITRPHVTRYYHWNMQYNDNAEIKGDYNVDARGTSVLLVKDQQIQSLSQVFAAKADPDVSLYTDWKKATEQLYAALRLDIMKSEEEIEAAEQQRAQAQPEQDPRIAGNLQVAQIKAEADMQKAQLTQQSDMAEIETKGQMTMQELQAKAEMAELDRQHESRMKEMDYHIKMMEYAERRNMNLDQVKAKLTSDTMKLKTQVALAGPDKEGPQVIEPLVEPEGRAKEGRAFQD